jgi:hypothetical protein
VQCPHPVTQSWRVVNPPYFCRPANRIRSSVVLRRCAPRAAPCGLLLLPYASSSQAAKLRAHTAHVVCGDVMAQGTGGAYPQFLHAVCPVELVVIVRDNDLRGARPGRHDGRSRLPVGTAFRDPRRRSRDSRSRVRLA